MVSPGENHYPPNITRLVKADYMFLIKKAFSEDQVQRDVSTLSIFRRAENAKANIIAKEAGILAGLDISMECFKIIDKKLQVKTDYRDGDFIKKKKIALSIKGNIQSILRAERVALNFLGLLSGIATKTQRIQNQLSAYNIQLLDTRKTLPGYRRLSKYAVAMGGGKNHRQHLADMGMIKENHMAQAGSIGKAMALFRQKYPRLPIEVEISKFEQMVEVLPLRPQVVLLDNMKPRTMRKCTDYLKAFNKNQGTFIVTEASGNFNESNLKKLKRTGVDFVSMGSLTHTLKPLDFSLLVTK